MPCKTASESKMTIQTAQWLLVFTLGIFMFIISPWARQSADFFKASEHEDKAPGVWLLTSGLVIAWIFAKSITNAANLGLKYGILGGVSYATYYFSFLVGGLVIYRMRTIGGWASIHQFIRSRYGQKAVVLFSLLIAFRLFNEIWSNTMVIGSYFGAKGSMPYYAAILVFTSLTLAYVLKGGLKTSILTDAIQMVLFTVLLFVILGILLPKEGGDITRFVQTGTWDAAHGINLMFVALIQVLSYPFHDPVLTDRGFISTPRVTLKAYIWATVIGFLCILLFSFVGIYAKLNGMVGEAAVEVSKSVGAGLMLLMNLIMITSAGSTLDSTFSSFSKLLVFDLGRPEKVSIARGRLAMVLVAVLGTIPVFLGPEVLSATTISGTMVIGLAPVFILWNVKAPPIAFHLSVICGIVLGLSFAFGIWPQSFNWFSGDYSDLLSINLFGTALCFMLFLVPVLLTRNNRV